MKTVTKLDDLNDLKEGSQIYLVNERGKKIETTYVHHGIMKREKQFRILMVSKEKVEYKLYTVYPILSDGEISNEELFEFKTFIKKKINLKEYFE